MWGCLVVEARISANGSWARAMPDLLESRHSPKGVPCAAVGEHFPVNLF